MTGSTVVDCISSSGATASFVGAGGLVMDGGVLRIKKLNDANPELAGTALNCNLTGGTIEFYGSGATQIQRLRGTDGNGNNITYHNIEINAAAMNLYFSGGSDLGNVTPSASFAITGTLNVNKPASFRLDFDNSISGSGNFVVNDGATLLYANDNGIKTSGTETSDGNIRISGTRTFSTNASYGFTGSQNMVSGNALPSEVVNLYAFKNADVEVSLTNSVDVKNSLSLQRGIIKTGTCSTGTSNTPLLSMRSGSTYTGGSATSHVNGVTRKIGNTAYTFPVGNGTYYAPLTIAVPTGASVSDSFTSCYNRTNPVTTFGSTKALNVGDVSTCEHWHLNSNPSTLSTQISLNLDTNRCTIDADICKKVIHWSGSQWNNLSNTASSPTSLTSGTTTARAPISYAYGVMPIIHDDPATTAESTKIGFGSFATMKAGFPTNIPSGFIAFDTKSKGMVIARIPNLASKPSGAEGLLIYYVPENCIQLFRDSDWHCIKAICE